MRKFIALMSLLGCVGLGSSSLPAHADSFSMAAGMQSLPGPVCYQFGFITPGLNKIEDGVNDCFNQQFVMPLYWRTFPGSGVNRTVSVRGKVPSGSLMSCTLYVYNSSGAIAAQSSAAFTPSANYTSINMTVNQVTSSASSVVTCASIGPTWLLKVDYTP